MKNFDKLEATEHMFKWLDVNPFEAIFTQVESMLKNQVPESKLNSFCVISEPQWLTGGRKNEEDESKVILVRTGVAFEFNLFVQGADNEQEQLNGVFSWVGVNLDSPEKNQQRYWLDVNETLETHGSEGELAERIYFES